LYEGERATNDQPETGIRSDVALFIAQLADESGTVKLIVHEFHSSFAEEVVPAKSSDTLSARQLRENSATIRENVVYTIRGRAV
jgi:predicted chitinase